MRRRKEQADVTNFGEYSIHGSQPIPFVNRVHPTKLEFEPLEEKVDPFKLSFCKLSFQDIDAIDSTLSFGNFSELWSEQMYDINRPQHGRKLAVGILGGKVLFAGSGPYLTIQDACNSKSACTFFVSQKALKAHSIDLVELGEVGGKIVEFMALLWYGYGSLRARYDSSLPQYRICLLQTLGASPNFLFAFWKCISEDLPYFL